MESNKNLAVPPHVFKQLDAPARGQSEMLCMFKACYFNQVEIRIDRNEEVTAPLVSLLRNKEWKIIKT